MVCRNGTEAGSGLRTVEVKTGVGFGVAEVDTAGARCLASSATSLRIDERTSTDPSDENALDIVLAILDPGTLTKVKVPDKKGDLRAVSG